MIRPTLNTLLCLALHLMRTSWIRALRVEVFMRKEMLCERDGTTRLVCLCKAFLFASNSEMARRRGWRRV